MLQRALGDTGFVQFQEERGVAEEYFLTPVQADAILKMTLGQLVNLEQEKLTEEHAELLGKITTFGEILDDESRVYDIIRDDCEELVRKLGSKRRTEFHPGWPALADIHYEVGQVCLLGLNPAQSSSQENSSVTGETKARQSQHHKRLFDRRNCVRSFSHLSCSQAEITNDEQPQSKRQTHRQILEHTVP